MARYGDTWGMSASGRGAGKNVYGKSANTGSRQNGGRRTAAKRPARSGRSASSKGSAFGDGKKGLSESRRQWLVLAFSMAVGFVMIAICSRTSFLYPFMDGVDQNCFMTVGKGMMNGLVPYRDLFEQKGPLLYFLHGLAWLVSHDTWLGVYILESLALGVFLWFSWKIWNLYGSRRWSFVWIPVLAALVTVSSPFASGDNVEEFCIALMAVSLYDYLRYLKEYPKNDGRMDAKTLLINGTLAGCVLWMKYTMLGFWFAWMATVFFCLILRKNWKQAFLSCLWFLCGMLGIATIPWVIYFGVHGAIGDWLYAYFYCNIFAYSSDGISLLSRLSFTWGVVRDAMMDQPLLTVSMAAGGVYLLVFPGRLPHWFSKISLVLTVALTFLGMYGGGLSMSYYYLFAYGFGCLGMIPAAHGLDFLVGKAADRNVQPHRIAAAGTMLAAVTAAAMGVYAWEYSRNTYCTAYIKEGLPQYQFAQIIRETPGASLLNYGFLDGGFYMAADVLPATRYFCQLNLRDADFPEMRDEQERLIRDAEVDYVVFRVSMDTDASQITDGDVWQNYTCVAQADQEYVKPGHSPAFQYYLFKKQGL